MSKNNFVAIGYTKKTHALQGEIKVSVEAQYMEDFLKVETVFIETGGNKLPYFIESVREGTDIIVKFEDIGDKNEAQAIVGKSLFLRESDIIKDEDRKIPVESLGYSFCTGYQMHDEIAGEVGLIIEITTMPQGEMALVAHKGNEIYVPMIPQFVVATDKKLKLVKVNLPEGLLDL
jgi:16S rRNA processing protein RimM